MEPRLAIQELARGALSGPEEVALQLFDIAAPVLLIHAMRRPTLRRLRDDSMRDSVGQAAIESVWNNREIYAGETVEEFYAWFHKICDSRVIDEWRGLRRRERNTVLLTPACAEEIPAPESGNSKPLDRSILKALDDCLDDLSSTNAQAFNIVTLHYLADVSIAGIRRMFPTKRSTAYAQRDRGRKILMDCLEGKGILAAP